MRACALAAAVACGVLGQPVVAFAQGGDEYAQFRQLAEPLRLIDTMDALVAKTATSGDGTDHHSATWHQAFAAAFERRISAKRDAIIDAVMPEAFKSFTPDEVERLTVVCQSPAVAHYESRKIETIRQGGSTDGLLAIEPGIRTMSPDDLRLLSRLNIAIGQALPFSRPIWQPLLRDAWHEADAGGR